MAKIWMLSNQKKAGGMMHLRKVTRLDSIRLDKNDKTYFTEEGYLVDHPILTSVGIFEYINEDGSIRRELRLPEHVFDEKSLETYKGKPIIITHDGGVISKDNVDKEQIGTIMSAGYQDGDNVRAEIIIHDTNAMKKSGLKELSLGYNLELIEEPGEWNGEPYDAIQTNIEINHLALVESARAGEQARLNIDSRKGKSIKGGNGAMAYAKATSKATDNDDLEKMLEEFKAKKEQRKAAKAKAQEDNDDVVNTDSGEEEEVDNKDNDDVNVNEDCGDGEVKTDGEDVEEDINEDGGTTPKEIVEKVKERRDRRDEEDDPTDVKGAMGVIAQQDSDIDMLLACLEKFFAEEKTEPAHQDGEDTEEEIKEDSSDDKSKSLNADSADRIFRERLSICRVGDKLRLDGLENKSIADGKKAIIRKVYPKMNLDGKTSSYIDALYDLAVGEVNKKKDVNYQRKQMVGSTNKRMDSKNSGSMAMSARQKMIENQGGNE